MLERRLKLYYALTSKSSLPPSTCSPTSNLLLYPKYPTISDTGARGYYLFPIAPCTNINPSEIHVLAGTAGGPPRRSSASCDLLLSSLPTTYFHIMPQLHHNLMGIFPLCEHGCHKLFEETAVTVFSKYNTLLLKGYRETFGTKLWRLSLRPNNTVLEKCPTAPVALNANDLSSVKTLVRYLHAAAGFLVKSTWITAIKAGNYTSWTGLASANAYKYFPVSTETL